MATEVILPALGMAQESGTILEWLKAEGDQVAKGEPLVAIETDKAAVELEAPASGTLAITRAAGEVVPVAEIIAVILAPGEVSPSSVPWASAAPAIAPAAAGHQASTSTATAPGRASPAGRRGASPKARRIAAAHGVDISTLRGSGPGGVVLAADVLGAAAPPNGRGSSALPVAPEPPPAPAASGALAAPALSNTWRLMADRTTQSWTTVPHFVLMREIHAAELINWRERIMRQGLAQATYTDLLVRAVSEALRHHPRLNASWEQGTISAHEEINIGLAVATDDGLVVPVIQHADELALRGIVRQRAELVERAQSGRLRMPDVQGGTFTISNLGMYGVDAFTAIINAPQAAILAVGRILERVVPVNGQPAVRPMMTLSLSCDHRVVDGARGAQFLAHLARLLEDPAELSN